MAGRFIVLRSRKAFLSEYVIAIAGILLLFAVSTERLETNLLVVLIASFAALYGLVKPEIIRMRNTCIITPETITVKEGILGRKEHQFHMATITDVNYQQNPWQRALGYGTLIIRSFSHAGKKIEIGNIDKPAKIMNLVNQLVDKKLDKPAPKPKE